MKVKKTTKIVACLLALVFLNSILFPTMSYALTGGPAQAEFQGFEPIGTTDMVNLSTGDMTYSVPVVSVPGPAGGFALPLSYHSGIRAEQDASWVGLGWSLNAGNISRSVSQYPDDFHGQAIVNSYHDDGGNGFGINLVGIFQYDWDSERGYGGSVGYSNLFRVGFGNTAGFTALGVSVSSSGNVEANALGVGMAVLSAFSISAGVSGGNSLGKVIGDGLTSKASIINNTIQSIAAIGNSGTASIGDWTVEKNDYFLFNNRKYWLDHSVTDYAYGSLYLGDVENSNNPNSGTLQSGSGSSTLLGHNGSAGNSNFKLFNLDNGDGTVSKIVNDTYFSINNNDYGNSINPTSIAYDRYNVSGNGVSGSIQPYRHDAGSLATTRQMASNGHAYNFFPFTESLGLSESEKTNFYYKGELTNNYQYHEYDGTFANAMDWNVSSGAFMEVNNYDSRLQLSNGTSKEMNRSDASLKNNRLARSKHISWFSNEEIISGTAEAAGFIDAGILRTNMPAHGIGGFMVTNANGATFHYSIPVYNTSYISKSQQADPNDYSSFSMDDDYAVNWLLTGITGVDFVDRSSEGTTGQLDETDWGYWVKFDYGKLSSDHKWRAPYIYNSLVKGEESNDGGSYTFGTKETYYLNTISTATHTAMFIKDVRKDGRGSYSDVVDVASSLSLEEIILLKNEDYDQLLLPSSSGGEGFTIASGNDPGNIIDNTVDDLDQVIDIYDIASDGSSQTTLRTFLDQHQVNRTKLNFDYSLCTGTVNSFDNAVSPPTYTTGGNLGKLTLNSIEVLGPNNNKILPDYDFTYSTNNPSYGVNKWDGWGMYAADGSSDNDSHYTSSTDDSWHLKEISLPTGATVNIDYERDYFSSISGERPKLTFEGSTITTTNGNLTMPILEEVDATKLGLSVGQSITLDVSELIGFGYVDSQLNGTISAISTNHIIVSGVSISQSAQEMIIKNLKLEGQLKPGGNVRVSEISVSDEFNRSISTKYIYTKDGSLDGESSGVVSQEPQYIRDADDIPEYHNYYDFPSTGVIYGKVTVLNNYQSATDYLKSSVYEFVTPHKDMITLTRTPVKEADPQISSSTNEYARSYAFKMDIETSGIGQLKSVSHYNQHNEFESSVEYLFADNKSSNPYGELGKYTEGSILTDFTYNSNERRWHFYRTTKNYLPTIPQAVVFKDNYSEKRVENTSYDHISGAVLETEYYDAWGAKYRTENVPAYTLSAYSGMGSKTANSSNKNMMTQPAGQYLYSYNEDGSQDLVSASVTTWDNDWTYREISTSGSTSNYADVSYTDEVYRTHKSYAWKSELNDDGTYATFTDFNHSSSTNPGWEKTSEVTLYDHYSRALESEDINGDKASTKYDISGRFNLLSAANANHKEIFFSGFELDPINNLLSDNLYFNSSSSAYSTDYVHTGATSLKLTGTEGPYANMDISDHETFIVSAWVHSSNWTDATLLAKFYANENPTPINSLQSSGTSAQKFKAGDWYLLYMEVPLASYSTADRMVVSVENGNTNTPLYVDDFKLTPFESASSCNVYDAESYKVVAVLDDQHLATSYEYDNNGILATVKQEVIDTPTLTGGFKLVKEYFYNYGKNN